MSSRDDVLELKRRLGESIVGQVHMIERLLLGLLADGHLLVEGLPGLAKTRAIKSLARNLDARLSRLQFTPDLLPADITGSEVYYTEAGKGQFRFQPGPIFANLILADEVNRAPAKVQSALLEAMEERQVTVGGVTHKLERLFLVMATQNPIEQEGTYPLPEAQMDRFLMHVNVGYPDAAAEAEIVRLARFEEVPAAEGDASAGGVAALRDAAAGRWHGAGLGRALAAIRDGAGSSAGGASGGRWRWPAFSLPPLNQPVGPTGRRDDSL